ncbi:hypothetical protein JHV675_52390 [Mycobacterium avium subsp. hominissuis]
MLSAVNGSTVPWGIAVDNGGTVYVTEHDKNDVVKYPPGRRPPRPGCSAR